MDVRVHDCCMQRTLQLLRKDFMPELGAASPSFQLQATFHEPGGGSTKDPVPLSQLGWEEMMGGVAVIEIVAIQSPSSGGLWADFGKPMSESQHHWEVMERPSEYEFTSFRSREEARVGDGHPIGCWLCL
jgi:hypothetical protein